MLDLSRSYKMKRTVEHKATPLECPYVLSTDDLKGKYASIRILQGDGFGNLSIIRITLPQLEEFIKDLKSLSKTPHQGT